VWGSRGGRRGAPRGRPALLPDSPGRFHARGQLAVRVPHDREHEVRDGAAVPRLAPDVRHEPARPTPDVPAHPLAEAPTCSPPVPARRVIHGCLAPLAVGAGALASLAEFLRERRAQAAAEAVCLPEPALHLNERRRDGCAVTPGSGGPEDAVSAIHVSPRDRPALVAPQVLLPDRVDLVHHGAPAVGRRASAQEPQPWTPVDAACRLVPSGAGEEALTYWELEGPRLRIPYPPPKFCHVTLVACR
jgi:hypothetical protein